MTTTPPPWGPTHQPSEPHDERARSSAYRELWRFVPGSLTYLIVGFAVSIVALSVLTTLFLSGVGMVVLVIGLPLIVGSLYAARGFGMADLTLLRLTGLPEIATPTWPSPNPDASAFGKLVHPLKSGHSWMYLLHQALIAPVIATLTFSVAVSWAATAFGLLTYWLWSLIPTNQPVVGDWFARTYDLALSGRALELIASIPLGALMTASLPVVLRGLARLHHGVAAAMLGRWPSDELAAEVRQESAARGAALHAEDAAMRRLERDLHDGPQQRLVRLQLDLATVERRVADGRHDEAATIAREAGLQAKAALDELRALSHGVAPPLLADRGLVAALAALAEDSPLPVATQLDPELDALVDPEVARALYFVVAELLTNAAKHSGARTVSLTTTLRYDEPRRLRLTVTDDGRGGATMLAGHGLAGLAERVAGHRGQLTIESPDGGPTRVEVTVPLRATPLP